ncbi:MAG: CoA pyrophosphatase [Litoreibacter sp.]|nr:CoA pyrophosphatase [Litoreibacter sp.]
MSRYSLEKIEAALGQPAAPSSDFDLNPNVNLPEGRVLRDAAVLIPIYEKRGELRLILTKRSSALKHHPGQIAFPGGKRDEADASLSDAALREAHEEIGLPKHSATLLGNLASHETVTGFQVTPFIAHISQPFTPTPEQGEVAEVFSVPFDHVLEPSNFAIQGRRWRGETRYYYTVPYGPYFIWGATARMLRSLADQVAL